jgi:hypothetical protein
MPTARDIALIFLSLEALVIALVPLAIAVGLAYGTYRLHRLVRVFLRKGQVAMQRVNDSVSRASDRLTRPLIDAHAAGSRASVTLKKLTRR